MTRLCWYVGERFYRDLKAKEEFSMRIIEGMSALADFLVGQVRIMEGGSEQARREAREQVPADRVKDAAVVARELRWRVRLAMGTPSDAEGPKKGAAHGVFSGMKKRKRESPADARDAILFRHFLPKIWDRVEREMEGGERKSMRVRRPDDEALMRMLAGTETMEDVEEEACVESRGESVRRIRRYEVDGALVVERQVVRLSVSRWTWPPS